MQTSVNQKKSALFNQIIEHGIQCKSLTARYFPREDILQQVKSIANEYVSFTFFLLRID